MNTLPIYARLHALAYLSDEDFYNACNAEEELHAICNGAYKPGHEKFFSQLTDYLYMIRSQALFDNSLLQFQSGLTWKEFYERLTKLYKEITIPFIADIMAANGKLWELKILLSINKTPTQRGANVAASNGHLEVLKWMKETPGDLPLPDQYGANWAAEWGQLNVLNWLLENDLTLPNQKGANLAASQGHMDVIQWMKEMDLPLPNQDGATMARFNYLSTKNNIFKSNLAEMLKYFASQNPPILPITY